MEQVTFRKTQRCDGLTCGHSLATKLEVNPQRLVNPTDQLRVLKGLIECLGKSNFDCFTGQTFSAISHFFIFCFQ